MPTQAVRGTNRPTDQPFLTSASSKLLPCSEFSHNLTGWYLVPAGEPWVYSHPDLKLISSALLRMRDCCRRKWTMERFLAVTQSGSVTTVWWPVVVQTRSFTRPVEPMAYDRVKIMLVRDGSAILFSEFGESPTRTNDLVVTWTATLCGALPEDSVTITTAYVDPDYLMDQLAWTHARVVPDRFAAESMIEQSYPCRAELIHLDPKDARQMGILLDKIEREQSRDAGSFYPTQAMFATVMHLLGYLLPSSPFSGSGMRSLALKTPSSRARYDPVRREVLRIEQALRADLAHRWTVNEMASIVHLSPRHLSRVFQDALGRSPISYLATLRAKEMTRLLRETDMSVAAAGQAVGWKSRTRARQAFTALTGITPESYRQKFSDLDTDTWHRDTDENPPLTT